MFVDNFVDPQNKGYGPNDIKKVMADLVNEDIAKYHTKNRNPKQKKNNRKE